MSMIPTKDQEIASLQRENQALRERVATLEGGIREHQEFRTETNLWRSHHAADLRLWSLVDASHDQERPACPDCGAEPDEDGWFPYGHDPECSIEGQSSE